MPRPTVRIAIQGETGSNSHMAVLAMLPADTCETEIVPCRRSAETLNRIETGDADAAVLPIENSLHGSVLEHYDLLLARPFQLIAEFNLRVRHNLIAAPGMKLADVRRVFSHPVALSQCRRWFADRPEVEAVSFYDTAGSVRHVMEGGSVQAAAIAPALAAEVFGGVVLQGGIEDHQENYTRFHLVVPEAQVTARQRELAAAGVPNLEPVNKMSLAFALEHQRGTLAAVLERLASLGADLTRIESRPVPGSPWEYVFYVDLRFTQLEQEQVMVAAVRPLCRHVRVLGVYRAAAG